MHAKQIKISIEFLGTAKSVAKLHEYSTHSREMPVHLKKWFEKLVEKHPDVARVIDLECSRVRSGYLISVNSKQFSNDFDIFVDSETDIVLFSTDVGG